MYIYIQFIWTGLCTVLEGWKFSAIRQQVEANFPLFVNPRGPGTLLLLLLHYYYVDTDNHRMAFYKSICVPLLVVAGLYLICSTNGKFILKEKLGVINVFLPMLHNIYVSMCIPRIPCPRPGNCSTHCSRQGVGWWPFQVLFKIKGTTSSRSTGHGIGVLVLD